MKFEHFADGEVDINGLSENEIIMKCDELFRSNPIPFIPQKGEHYKVQKEMINSKTSDSNFVNYHQNASQHNLSSGNTGLQFKLLTPSSHHNYTNHYSNNTSSNKSIF